MTAWLACPDVFAAMFSQVHGACEAQQADIFAEGAFMNVRVRL